MSLSHYSDEALQEELKRRAEVKEKLASVPTPRSNPDWEVVLKYTETGLNQVALGGGTKAWIDNIFSVVMETIYGKQFWTFWDKAKKKEEVK